MLGTGGHRELEEDSRGGLRERVTEDQELRGARGKPRLYFYRVTNGEKTTLSQSLHQLIPNSCIISQDSYFKDDYFVPADSNSFKQYDTLDALHMDKLMSVVDSWRTDPALFLRQRDQNIKCSSNNTEIFVLIVEGFLVFNYRPLNELFDKIYFLEIPYVCKRRRSSWVYNPPDPPGYFDGYIWPMYLKNHQELERIASEIAFLDGLRPKEELLAAVYEDVCQEIDRLQGVTTT
ncbi:nicotinamide riboside kinase 1-like [Nematolebias whitei]|uniref:nicotinamide riboside kinase 1-like n=1 Tax=Nematolebias whitei TaxID=451745 RepID=UPI001899608A|nr:nicotinamide riboside kinase 1-like [Nematolebias whitei]